MRQIYAEKGFAGAELERVVELVSAVRERWIRTMMTEEYGLAGGIRSAWIAGAMTFAAFVACGLMPLNRRDFEKCRSVKVAGVL